MRKPIIKLFCSDLDGTLLGADDDDGAAVAGFRQLWQSVKPPASRPLLCYSSGRTVQNILELLLVESLPEPDFIIGAVGTQIYDFRRKRNLTEFPKNFGGDWSLAQIETVMKRFASAVKQPADCQSEYKSSWYLTNADAAAIRRVRDALGDGGVKASVVYSDAKFLDIVPEKGGKGNALEYLCRRLGVKLSNVVAAGDSGNDECMLRLPQVKGIIVANARRELFTAAAGNGAIFKSRQNAAGGVVEGLRHHRIF